MIEALVQDKAVRQIQAHLAPDMGWEMTSEPRDGHAFVRLTRAT